MEHVAQHGVRDTSLRSLAAAIGTSQRMLSYHFGSREGLLVAVIEVVVADATAALTELFAHEQDPFVAGRENWRRAADGSARFGALFFELTSHAMYGQEYARELGRIVVTEAEAAFAAAYRGVVDEGRAATLARLTLAAGHGLLLATLVDGDRAASDRAIEELIGLVRAGVAGEPAPTSPGGALP